MTWYQCEGVGDEAGRNILESNKCFNDVRNLQVLAICFSSGYFFADMIMMAFFTKGTSTYYIVMHIHHFLTCVTGYLALRNNNFTAICGTLCLSVEVSMIFISIRWIFLQHKL